MRILVVDDSEEARDIVEAMLLSAGYKEVSAVASAVDAYRFLSMGDLKAEGPASVDLILLDIVMAEIDGIEACARIRSDPRHADVPIIMVTSLSDMESLANAFVAGATDYIIKPVNRVELLARSRSALRLKAEFDRRRAREAELLQFMSRWGENRAGRWIDEATGLFVGEVAEAYLVAAGDQAEDTETSVIALAIDRFEAYRSATSGAATRIKAQVAHALRAMTANIGTIAAVYRDGVFVLIVPEMGRREALALAESLRAAIARLAIRHSESIAADHVTASVAVVTGRINHRADRVSLLTRAVSSVPSVVAAGGNRVAPHHV
jgi:PleD family two-component response regulator